MAYADAAQTAPQRLRVRVRGAVQGVGFRPFVHDLATRLRLDGFVKNDAAGVLLEVQGERVNAFLDALSRRPPPLARVEAIEVEELPSRESSSFVILDSVSGASETRIIPDAAVCDDCLDELFDPASRFHLYPFVTCTHCGPRYTLTRRLPYDRAQTSMAPFAMCRDCARDYREPANRRFHAEPICCPQCGPKLSASPADIVMALRAGKIVATKGVGGFHLICDARNRAAVEKLRRRKARDAKPFAVMAANVSSVASIARATDQELDLLQGVARPIVLMQSRGVLAEAVAPRLNRLGVMLPYAPLHHLIFHAAAGAPTTKSWLAAPQELVLVATSANLGGDALVKDNDEAQARLAAIADLIVTHDREIVTRLDDSVMSVVAGAPAFLRRARGFTPEPIELAADGPSVIAAGAHLKATITVTRGREAFVSQHVGDLSNAATARFYRETAQRLIELLDVKPEFVACDLHPDYYSTRWAEEQGLPLMRVQHHAAHLAAILAEHRVEGSALGLALDGHGLGDAGQSWGGELMRLDSASWRRLGGLAPLPAPGASWEFARLSLPNYLQSNYGQGAACCSSDETQYNEAVYIGQLKGTLGPVKLATSYQFFNDRILDDTDGTDLNGRSSRTFAKSQVAMLKGEGSVAGIDLKGALYGSTYKAPLFDQPWINSPKSDIRGKAIKLDASFASLPVTGLSVNYQYFNIGAGFYSNTASRREVDVLLTEGSEAAWHRWGQSIWLGGAAKDYQQVPSSAKCFVSGGGVCRSDSGLAPGANGLVDNDFMDFDEAPAESVQGWKGHTVLVNYEVAKIPMSLELTRIGYNYNRETVTSALANFFAASNDRRTNIGVFKIGYVVPAMGGIELGAKVKRVLDKNNFSLASAADDRETRDSGYTLSAGNQLFGDLYGTVSYGRYTRDIRTAALSIDNEKSITGIRLAYNLAGFETGLLSQWISGDGDPGETGVRSSIKQYRLKAFVKAIF